MYARFKYMVIYEQITIKIRLNCKCLFHRRFRRRSKTFFKFEKKNDSRSSTVKWNRTNSLLLIIIRVCFYLVEFIRIGDLCSVNFWPSAM